MIKPASAEISFFNAVDEHMSMKHDGHMCKIANYSLKDSWLFVVRTEKVRYFLYFGLMFHLNINNLVTKC